MKSFVQWSAYFNIASGVLMLAFWYLYAALLPYGRLTNTLAILVQDRHWTMVNLLGASGALLGIVGLVGLFIRMDGVIGPWGTAGFIIALLGSILMYTTLQRDTLIWPILVKFDPFLLDFTGPIYTSKTFMPVFIFSGVVYTVGYVLFGLSIAGSGIFPPLAGHFLAWGALLFILGSATGGLQVYVRSVGITGFSLALIWLGWLMR